MPRVQATGADLEEFLLSPARCDDGDDDAGRQRWTAVACCVLLALNCARVLSPGHREKKAYKHLQQKVVLGRERTFQSKPESQ